jgi:hypothetical protein
MTSYFCFLGQFYKQVYSVVMGLPLSPVITKFCVEDFEDKILNRAPHKPLCWVCCMYMIFVIWPYSPTRLKDFLNHLNLTNAFISPWRWKVRATSLPLARIFTGHPMIH